MQIMKQSDSKKIIKEISKGKNLSDNLKTYGDMLGSAYAKEAMVTFAMEFYTFCEILEAKESLDELTTKMMHTMTEDVIGQVVGTASRENRQDIINRLDSLRDEVFHHVEILTAYADIFARYEYVSNRCEYLFQDTDLGSRYSDEDFTRQIMKYIFSDEDNNAINTKIREVLEEIPLRLTKNKFFEYLSEGMTVYNQADAQTVDDFMYEIRSSAMLDLPDGMEQMRDLYELFQYVKNMNYDTITEEEFKNLEQRLLYAADFIEEETDLYTMMQSLINHAYAALLCLDDSNMTEPEIRDSVVIIRELAKEYEEGEYRTVPEEVADLFEKLEGVPEKLQGMITGYEYALDNIREQYMDEISEELKPTYRSLFITQCLMTDSLFIDLDAAKNAFSPEEEEAADMTVKEYVAKKREELVNDLTTFFRENPKLVNRSVQAMVLSRLPVFFGNITEIQDFVYQALAGCTNKAEKKAVVELLRSIMSGN